MIKKMTPSLPVKKPQPTQTRDSDMRKSINESSEKIERHTQIMNSAPAPKPPKKA